jgi:diadenylate cyclase
MTNFLDRLASLEFTWRDGLDIALVAFILYQILRLIRGTRAMQMAIGLALLGVMFFLARTLDLLALETLSSQILFYLPFAVIVLFQHEIRRALAIFGRNPLATLFGGRGDDFDAVELASVVSELASRRIGALIVIERTQNLRLYVERGKPLGAILTRELLMNIFTPHAPLHDGAVIIEGNRIAAAAVFLPLVEGDEQAREHGTRHRAAIGMSEETDALVIVVSEESGSVSCAVEGRLYESLDESGLRELLLSRRWK